MNAIKITEIKQISPIISRALRTVRMAWYYKEGEYLTICDFNILKVEIHSVGTYDIIDYYFTCKYSAWVWKYHRTTTTEPELSTEMLTLSQFGDKECGVADDVEEV